MNQKILRLPSSQRLSVILQQVRLVLPREENGRDRTEALALTAHIALNQYDVARHIVAQVLYDVPGALDAALAPLTVALAQEHTQTLYRLRACEFFLNNWRP